MASLMIKTAKVKGVPLAAPLLEDFALIPKWQRFSNADARLKFLGGFLLISGMLVQLMAAFLDFNS